MLPLSWPAGHWGHWPGWDVPKSQQSRSWQRKLLCSHPRGVSVLPCWSNRAVAGLVPALSAPCCLAEGSLTPVRDAPCTPRLRSVSSYGNIRAVTTARNLNKSLQNLSLNEECKAPFRTLPLFSCWHCSSNCPAPRAGMRSSLIISSNFLVISIDFSECLGTQNVPSSFQA